MAKTLRLKLPKGPVDGFEVTYFTIRSDRVQEIRLKYHINSKWSDVCTDKGGADFINDWQVFVNGYFSARMLKWRTPATVKHKHDYATREDAVTALKDYLESRARQADKQARDYREQAAAVA